MFSFFTSPSLFAHYLEKTEPTKYCFFTQRSIIA